MREQKEFDLDWEGRRCLVGELGALPARQVARRLLNILGKAARDAASKSVLETDMEMLALIGLGSVLEQLDDETTEWLTKTFTAVTKVEREAGLGELVLLKDVDQLVFSGPVGLARWGRWLAYCLEVSCGDFFAAAFAEVQRLKPRTPPKATTAAESSASASPTSSLRSGNFTA